MKTFFPGVFKEIYKYLWLPSKHSQGSVVKERTWTKEVAVMLKNRTMLCRHNSHKTKMISPLEKLLFLYISITFQAEIHASFETPNPLSPRIHAATFKICNAKH